MEELTNSICPFKTFSKAGSQQITDFLRNEKTMHKINFEHTHYQRLRILCELSKDLYLKNTDPKDKNNLYRIVTDLRPQEIT